MPDQREAFSRVLIDQAQGGRPPDIVKRNDTGAGVVVLPKSWIVERTPAWLGRYRRLSKDYGTLPPTGESMIYLAMINLTIHRLQTG